MASTSVAIPILVIRIIALLSLAGAVALMVTNNEKSDGEKISFKDFYAYRYVVAAGVVGFAYSLLQLPFAVYYVATGKRMIKNGLLPAFDFFGDKIMSWFLATAVGAGIALTYGLKKVLVAIRVILGASDDEISKLDQFLNGSYISIIEFLAVAFFCLAILSVLSSLSRNPSSSKGFFG